VPLFVQSGPAHGAERGRPTRILGVDRAPFLGARQGHETTKTNKRIDLNKFMALAA